MARKPGSQTHTRCSHYGVRGACRSKWAQNSCGENWLAKIPVALLAQPDYAEPEGQERNSKLDGEHWQWGLEESPARASGSSMTFHAYVLSSFLAVALVHGWHILNNHTINDRN